MVWWCWLLSWSYVPGGVSSALDCCIHSDGYGGGLPAAHAPFFSVGKKFRVPMYLATSFDEDVAYR